MLIRVRVLEDFADVDRTDRIALRQSLNTTRVMLGSLEKRLAVIEDLISISDVLED